MLAPADGNGRTHRNWNRGDVARRNLRFAAAVILFQLLLGTSVMLSPGSWRGYNPVLALPVVFALLPGSGGVALLLNVINDLLIHYVGPTPGFPNPVWVPAVLALEGIVLLAALSAVKGRASRPAYWALLIAELTCIVSPLGPLFSWSGFPLALLIPVVVPLLALALLVAGGHRFLTS